jgi:hypothetical protein
MFQYAFESGDGVGGTEAFAGDGFLSNQECAQYVQENHPNANGATYALNPSLNGQCWAEIGMTGRNDLTHWESVFLSTQPPASTPDPSNSLVPTSYPTSYPTTYPTVDLGACFDNDSLFKLLNEIDYGCLETTIVFESETGPFEDFANCTDFFVAAGAPNTYQGIPDYPTYLASNDFDFQINLIENQ